MLAFREVIEAHDPTRIADTLAEGVVFTSPVGFRPYPGKALTTAILQNVMEVFDDFRYIREIGADGDADRALVFEATIHGKQLTGCDFLHLDEDGKIDDFMVMVRPLSAAKALAEEMSARFPRIQEQASAR